MADSKNRGLKWLSGVLGTIVLIFGLYVGITDRAEKSGEAKATTKSDIEAVDKKIETLGERVAKNEESAEKVDNVLFSKTKEGGLVTAVQVMGHQLEDINGRIDALGEQNKLIIGKLDELKK